MPKTILKKIPKTILKNFKKILKKPQKTSKNLKNLKKKTSKNLKKNSYASDSIALFQISAIDGSLDFRDSQSGVAVALSGPTQVEFDPSGKFVYVLWCLGVILT
jgi:6-phosphogluconolactonase (cycloisomerase 2 family)